MEKSLVLDDQFKLWLLLSQTRSAVFKVRHKKVGRYLHPTQAAALVTTWAFDGQITPARLSRILFLERHSVSELLTRMEEKGLIRKTRDSKRKNIVRIKITKEGREVCSRIMGIDLVSRIMSSLSEEQQEQLWTCLYILLSAAMKELDMEVEVPFRAEPQKDTPVL